MKADFLIIGAMKSGTTWTDDMLRAGSDARLPVDAKETFFLDKYWERGAAWYAELFGADGPGGPVGEVASSYYADAASAWRAHGWSPDARIVAILREPAGRAWSHYQHFVRKGVLRPGTPFGEAVQRSPEILGWSRYDELMPTWLEAFPGRVSVLPYELIRRDAHRFATLLGEATGVVVDLDRVDGSVTYSSRAPRWHWLSSAAARVSGHLHEAGLHKAVNAVKKMGASKLVEQSVDPDPQRDQALAAAGMALAESRARTLAMFPQLKDFWTPR